jgi:V/A-type H+-transporting ATPase subunit A
MEGRFHHKIMVPFALMSDYTLTWVAKGRLLLTSTPSLRKAVDLKGQRSHQFTMVQKWPVKSQLFIGDKIKATRMMDTGERIIDTQFPVLKGGTFLLSGAFRRRKDGSSAPFG